MAQPAETGSELARFRVYYDGLCPLCSREIAHYRKHDPHATVDWIDITGEGFDAAAEGLDPAAVHRFFHVKDEQGRILVGVSAFIEIWSRLPAFKRWQALARIPGVRPLMELGYAAFARVRPYLPRRARADCTDGLCAPTRGP